jgi:hypothetical protein
MKPPWKRVGVFQERHADEFELGKNVEIEMPCFFFAQRRGLEGPEEASLQTLSVHNYKKNPRNKEITQRSSKSAQKTLDLAKKRDPALQIFSKNTDEASELRPPPHHRGRATWGEEAGEAGTSRGKSREW